MATVRNRLADQGPVLSYTNDGDDFDAAMGAEAVYEFELSSQEKDAFAASVAANTELMNIARGFLT